MSYENLSTARHGIKNFKGRLEIDAPIERVAHVLFDPETQGRWIGGLMNVSLLEIDSTENWANVPKTFQLYQEFHLPSPIWDRDYVLAGEWSVDFDGDHVRKAVLHLQSITREDCPVRDDRVRAALNLQLYTLTPTSGGSATQVDVEINVDPLGNFPVFFVNLYGSIWCGKTLAALEKVVLSK